MPQNPPIVAGTRIGHVHLKVADLERALGFYCGVLGFELMQRYGTDAAFISAGGYHHHIGLNTWESKGGHPPPAGTTTESPRCMQDRLVVENSLKPRPKENFRSAQPGCRLTL